MLVDSHAHIQFPQFAADRESVLERAWQAGLTAIVVVGTNIDSSQAAIAMAGEDPRLYATVGVHPHHAATLTDDGLGLLSHLVQAPRVVALGETGLDFYRNLSPRDVQVRAFQQQLALAGERDLPVVVHSRDADAETYTILAQWARGSRPLGVMHCFGGDLDLALRYIELGFFISVSGTVTYPKADRVAQVVASIPLDWILAETDCPYLTPQSRRGRRNEPALIAEIVAKIASLRGISAEEVAERTSHNAARLFGLKLEGREQITRRKG